MNDFIGIIGILACLTVIWGLMGLFKPNIVLWWAVPEKKSRSRAFAFTAVLALTFFCFALVMAPQLTGWLWVVPLLGLFTVIMMIAFFRKTAEELQLMEEERKWQKKTQTTRTVYSTTSDKEYEINPFLVMCSCKDWEARREDAEGPFSVCKHLAEHYTIHPTDIPEELVPYKSFFIHFGCADKGIPPQGDVYGYGIVEGMAYLFTGYADSLPWVNVYDDISAPERYGFNTASGKWAKKNTPPHADVITKHIVDAG